MNTNILKGWLQSSQDPTQVANKVKGGILLLSSVIIFFAAAILHVSLSANDVVSLATEGGATAGAIWTIYGTILHVVTWIGSIQKSTV